MTRNEILQMFQERIMFYTEKLEENGKLQRIEDNSLKLNQTLYEKLAKYWEIG